MSVLRTLVVASLVVIPLAGSPGQLRFAAGSNLADSVYVASKVRTIADAECFAALDLDAADLKPVRDALRRHGPEASYRAWGDSWTRSARPRYVTKTSQLLIDTDLLTDYEDFRATLAARPAERDTIVARANELLRNTIRTWGDRTEQFGPVVDFNRDVGQSGRYGFHYWWWARPLVWAALLTGDERYLDKFQEFFNQWYDQRNSITRGFPDLDVVFYELGISARTRVFAEYLLMPHRNRTPRTYEQMLKTLLGGARWLHELERHEGYRPGNWQIVGSYTLVQIALLVPEFRESPAWLATGLQRLEEHLERDFFEDGGHSERAPRNYTLLTYLSYRNVCSLLERHDRAGETARLIRSRMGRTIDWWVAMIAPTGEIPAYNDSHRGLFPADILRDGAEYFARPAVSGVLRHLFGERGDTTLPAFRSRHLPASGFTVMRTDWSREALYFNTGYGPYASHTHNDLLSFEIYAYGRALVVDAGIGMTYDDPLYLTWYKSAPAHNTVVVNGKEMKREGIRGEDVRWGIAGEIEYFAAGHNGYLEAFGVRHRRQVVFVKPDFWFVLDDLAGTRPGDTLSWYLHSPTVLRPAGWGFRSESGPGLMVLPATRPEAVRTGEGMAASTVDLRPGQVQSINWIRFDLSGKETTHVQFPVLLLPFRENPPEVRLERVARNHYRVTTGSREDQLIFGGGGGEGQAWETDAALLYLRSEDGKRTATVIEGTYLRRSGTTLWRSGVRASASAIAW